MLVRLYPRHTPPFGVICGYSAQLHFLVLGVLVLSLDLLNATFSFFRFLLTQRLQIR